MILNLFDHYLINRKICFFKTLELTTHYEYLIDSIREVSKQFLAYLKKAWPETPFIDVFQFLNRLTAPMVLTAM